MKRYLIITTSIILITGVSLYFGLGGNNDLSFQIVELPARTVYGELFEGRPTEQKLEALFVDSRERSQESGLPLAVINYEQTDQKRHLRQFIGTINGPRRSTTLAVVELPAGKYVSAEISSHTLVMPRPDEIKEAATEFTESKGLQIVSGISYEIYEDEHSNLVVMFQCL